MTDNATGAWRDARFRKSSHTGPNADCVEVARAGARFGLRDSKDPMGPVLAVAIARGEAFLTAIKREQIAAP
ncbi:MAG TPA: DUF397 domain-containing protein [Actinophytocola sp.]|uniref:DUF397 domain-containing protein n=1 Tax=Actinophytocola sp. TaxID=1872138 RepID=UPI002DDD27C6|nr:DUF397 domain-containing protein [Actinophytocola sp.]HEV2784410.1 DUF397 domain-containing protein [Actinophytocola sp.]